MASVIPRPGRQYWLQFTHQGIRPTWCLGRIPKKTAETYKLMLEDLLASNAAGEKPSKLVKAWLAELPPKHKDWLAKRKLIPTTDKPRTLKEFGDFIIAKHYKNSPRNTVRNMRTGINGMLEQFGDVDFRAIRQGDLDVWREDLIAEGNSHANVAFYLKKARRVLNLAVKHGVIERSPFSDIAIPSEKNPKRLFYVDIDTIRKLLRVCSPDWQAAVCLCRFAGMRFPSEVFGLEWERINWDLARIVVRKTKTKRDVAVPMAPEVRHTLNFLWDSGDCGQYVFPHYASQVSDRAGYQQLKRLIVRAGLTPWPRLTTNLRVSIGVDWKNAGIPAATIAEWLDHTEAVHAAHYDLISDVEFGQAQNLDSGLFSIEKRQEPRKRV